MSMFPILYRSAVGEFNSNTVDDLETLTFVGLSRKRQMKIIGHPRFGSGYASRILGECGHRVGHEKVWKSGVVSWMLAVDDLNYPYGTVDTRSRFIFKDTYLYMRNPLHALPSVIFENRSPKSFSFRRTHIYRAFGVDLASFKKSPVNMAIASILYWYKLCEINNPTKVLYVDKKDKLEEFLLGLGSDPARVELALQMPKVNTSDKKWPGRKKPDVHELLEKDVDKELLEKFFEFSRIYGYETSDPGSLLRR